LAYIKSVSGHFVLVVGYGYFREFGGPCLIFLDPGDLFDTCKRGLYSEFSGYNCNSLICEISASVTSYNNPIARLVYFLPSIYSRGVKVKFATSFEDGTSRFVLQRFNRTEESFEAIGTVESRGNGAEGAVYELVDNEGSEDDVYRLMEVEEDGDRCILGLSKVYSKDPLASLNLKKRESLCEISELRRGEGGVIGEISKG